MTTFTRLAASHRLVAICAASLLVSSASVFAAGDAAGTVSKVEVRRLGKPDATTLRNRVLASTAAATAGDPSLQAGVAAVWSDAAGVVNDDPVDRIARTAAFFNQPRRRARPNLLRHDRALERSRSNLAPRHEPGHGSS